MKRLFTLIALACLVGSVNLLAQNSLGIIDFTGLGEHQNSGDFDYNGYLREVEGRLFYISNGTRQIRIQLDNTDNWGIFLDDQGNSYLNKKANSWHSLFIDGLVTGDKVKITPKGNICFGNDNSVGTQELGPYSDFNAERTFTITGNGRLEVKSQNQNVGVYKIEVFGDGGSVYHYDPSIEGYDLYWVGGGATYEKIDAGFTLDTSGQNAILLAQLSDHTPLSRRIAISKNSDGTTPWSLSNFSQDITQASQGLYNSDVNTWHNLSICNLKVGARVRITFHNEDFNPEGNEGHAKFGSISTNSYNGCAAFQDTNNNGAQDAGEPSVTAGLNLAGKDNSNRDYVTYFYTITQDGHLDIAFDGKVRLCQVEIYNDHLATMVDRDNGSHQTGFTSYFNNTGQLQAKTHVVPGGLKVQVGSEDVKQHAGVVASPYNPMAFVYDETHRKFPRNSDKDFNTNESLLSSLPTEGTFHKFTPEVDGKMIVNFFTTSINYLWTDQDGSYSDMDNTSNENSVDVNCPYYLIKVDQNGNKQTIKQINSFNEKITWEEDVQAGYTYYLFGGWSAGADANNYSEQKSQWMKKNKYGCGIANLLDVTFIVDKAVRPLAKWIENASTEDNNLAYVKGYKYVKVKKMSGGITSCEPYLDGTTLKIRNIQYATGDVDKAGVVLIEITDDTDNYDRTDPVFALTVAYDASYHSTPTTPEEQRGHTWDFSSTPLQGLEWTNYSGYADNLEFGTYYENYFGGNTNLNSDNTLLSRERNWTDVHGTQHSDWTLGYRQQNQGNNFDPQLLNHYALEGDNADMMWDTEGVVMFASADHSSIFNEFQGENVHSSSTDPDRYVGIWYGGEFLIPWLDKDDRVIIWMGSGTGTGGEQMKFNITNARDAEYKEINPNDEYIAGGSQWNGANSDNYYRGCYHFFAKEKGDMRFKLLDDGSYPMCKIYKIQIYHGDRINTNEIKGATTNDNHYLLWSRDNDPNDGTGKAIGSTYNWTLNYFGKDQKIADGSNGVNNGIVELQSIKIKSGVNINDNGFTTSTVTDPTQPLYNTFTYQHDYGQIGTFRMRGKDMEKNMKYVADYGDHNVTVAYQQTMRYPYTWDFMDMIGYNSSNFSFEDEIGIGSSFTSKRPDWFESDDIWNASYEKSSYDLSLWEKLSGNNPAYDLRLNSQKEQGDGNLKEKDNIFETAIVDDGNHGNQVWANGAVVPETQGLWFYSYNNNQNNGKWGINSDGMDFGGTSKDVLKIVVPNVPANAAVYLRMVKNREVGADYAYEFMGGNTNLETYGPVKVDGTNEYILAIMNKGTAKRHLTLSIAGYRLKKLAVSTDPKKIGSTGYATESRAEGIGIDHNLTAYLTGKDIKAYTGAINADNTQLVMTQFGATETSAKILPAATDGDSNGCILHHSDGAVSILNGGFHVFVPDMHDKINSDRMVSTTTNVMKSFLPGTTDASTKGFLGATAGDNTNLVLTAKKYSYGTDGSTVQSGTEVNFVRVDPKGNNNQGASLSYCSAYLQLPTSVMVPLTGSSNGGNAKLSIVFVDELFGEVSQGIATGIVDLSPATGNNPAAMEAEWYNLSGQKLNGQPTEKGMYIVNGKKVLVK